MAGMMKRSMRSMQTKISQNKKSNNRLNKNGMKNITKNTMSLVSKLSNKWKT